ncbi:MAG TPA: hypothetical protein VGS57_19850 [Thermoanaerobaculia bacterium]|jgi:hypothetical protein|nr:hypothetical protein [Thermoanaerobaculia bacterium]
MRPSFKLAALAVLSTGLVAGREGMAAPPSAQAALAAGCQPFFAAASKPPVAMHMNMPGMQMLDAVSGPLPLVCLTMKDPPQPPLFDGIGHPFIQVSSDTTIQSYFDQGLRFQIGFNNRESYRAFRFAAETAATTGKPCAWCYWGAALPLGTDINMSNELELDRVAANEYLDKARALKPTGLLAQLIEATAKRSENCLLGEDQGHCRARRNSGYYEAMQKIRADYPSDPNVGVFFVDSILNLTPWRLPAHDKFVEARDTLEALMTPQTKQNGLIHWYIHLMELSDDAGRAEPRANQLAALAPNAGHLVHMPSHIYYRIGDMRRVIDSNVAASKADETYFGRADNKLEHPDGDRYRYGYYPHTLHFLAAGATLFGHRQWVNNATERLYASAPPDAEGYRKDKYREVFYLARVNLATPAEIRSFVVPPKPPPNVQPRGNAAYAYTQVMADLWEGKPPTLSLPAFVKAVADYPITGDPNEACRHSIATNGDTGLCVVAIENNLVKGRIAASQNKWDDALGFTQQAVDLQTALAYDEPPDWLYSLHQSHAAVQIRRAIANDPYAPWGQERLRQAKDELVMSLDPKTNRSDVFPGSGWAYFGLWQVAQYLKGEDKAAAEAAFKAHWATPNDPKTFPTLDRM